MKYDSLFSLYIYKLCIGSNTIKAIRKVNYLWDLTTLTRTINTWQIDVKNSAEMFHWLPSQARVTYETEAISSPWGVLQRTVSKNSNTFSGQNKPEFIPVLIKSATCNSLNHFTC